MRDPLQEIPGVGESIAHDLRLLGIERVRQLRGKNPDRLYARSNALRGMTQDRCLLYVFRCAVYYASEPRPAARLLKWWNWSDENLAKAAKRAS